MTQAHRRVRSLLRSPRLGLLLAVLTAPAWADPEGTDTSTDAPVADPVVAPVPTPVADPGEPAADVIVPSDDDTKIDDATKSDDDGKSDDGKDDDDTKFSVTTCDGGLGVRWIADDGFTGTCADPAVDCPCPEVDGWKASRAFAGAGALPPVLAPYCLYEWPGKGAADPKAVAALTGKLRGTVRSLGEDCVVVAPQTHPVNDVVRPWLRSEMRGVAGGSEPLPLGTVPPATIEIAALDSSPTDIMGAIPLGNLEHGYVTGWLGHDLTSDGVTSFGLVSTWLALPYLDAATVDRVHGGSFGTRGELAQRIVDAVTLWKTRTAVAPRLVMPLALGWDPAFGPPGSAPSRAVHDAILHAVCHGAFVAAAAGNDAGGPAPATGALLPAAWESEIGPTVADCEANEGVGSLSNLLPNYGYAVLSAATPPAPLVVSVAGVDYADRPIALTRPGSVTHFAALAFQGTSGAPGAATLPPPHTGTSIGVTVAGAAAASVWAYDPSLTAPEVLALIEATAAPISTFDPAQCVGGLCDVLRISVPDARDAACAATTGNPRCPAVAAPSTPPPVFTANPTWPTADITALTSYFSGAPVSPALVVPASPFELTAGAATPAWVHPQPLQPGCSVCTLVHTTGSLDVEISSTYPTSINNVTVTIPGTFCATSYRIATTMTPGQALRTGISPTSGTRATISWTLASTGAAVSEQMTVF
jgi:hypothetical protein